MSKKTNSNVCHFENYIQIQKYNCVWKIRFNNDELTPWAKKVKTLYAIETKWGIKIFRIFTVLTYREGKGINVQKIL